MLIGAPLDQNRQPGTNRSGALWQCPLSTYTRDCTQVITDGRLSMSPIYFSILLIVLFCDNFIKDIFIILSQKPNNLIYIII